jgi:hypothetical protein
MISGMGLFANEEGRMMNDERPPCDPRAVKICSYGGVAMTCRCGHVAPMDDFCRTPVFGDLPAGIYQCPECGVAVDVRHGKIETCEARL